MARCQGITKSGSRCKRTVPDGVAFCAQHQDQAAAAGPGPGPGAAEAPPGGAAGNDEAPGRTRPIESFEDLFHVAIGMAVAVAVLWLIRKGTRLPGL